MDAGAGGGKCHKKAGSSDGLPGTSVPGHRLCG